MADGTGVSDKLAPPEAGKLNVFISYSRDDLDFADQLDITLEIAGFDPTLDRHGIHGAENWQEKLGALIRDADTVVFVLTPASAVSKICAWEVEEAVKLGKRIIPVVPRALGEVPAPPQLAALNYIYFFPEPRKPESGFRSGVIDLIKALKTDLNWQREHTRLLQRAIEWSAGGRQPNRLLSGGDIAEAKAWAARRPKDSPAPTELHLELIQASEAWDAEQQSERQRQLEERERMVRDTEEALKREAGERAAREEAQRDAAEAAKREAEQARRVARRTIAGLVASLLLAIVASWASYSALTSLKAVEASVVRANLAEQNATRQAAEANAQEKVALLEKQRAEAQTELVKAANIRLNRRLSLRIAPFESGVQKVKETWLKIATDYTAAVAAVGKSYAGQFRASGTGFLIRGGALYKPWGDETVFVTVSHVIGDWSDRTMRMQGLDIREAAAVFLGLEGNSNRITFSGFLWQSIEQPPDGVHLSVLRIEGPLPFGAHRIEHIQATPLGPLPLVDETGAITNGATSATNNNVNRVLATIGILGDSGASLMLTRLLGAAEASKSRPNSILIYTYASGGGASGSPIFDAQTGELLAVHFLGNVSKESMSTGQGIALQAAVAQIAADPLWSNDQTKAYLSRGRRLLEAGKDDEAKAQFDLAIARDAKTGMEVDTARAQAHADRGKALLEAGKDDEAKAQFDLAIARDAKIRMEVDTAWVEAYADRGVTLLRARKDDEAKAQFALALERDPGASARIGEAWVDTYLDRGAELLRKGSDDEAKAQFALALERDPGASARIGEAWIDVYLDRGAELLRKGSDDEAKAQFALALERDSGASARIGEAWGDAYRDRGADLLRKGLDDEANGQFKLALDHNPNAAAWINQNRADTYSDRGDELIARGKWDEANIQFGLALEAGPSNNARSKIHTRIASGWLLRGNPAAGLADAERAVAYGPDDESASYKEGSARPLAFEIYLGQVLAVRGQIYLALGRFNEAFADLDKAISKGFGGSDAFYARGRCQEIRGNREAAIADYRKSLEIRLENDDYNGKRTQSLAGERLTALGAALPTDVSPPP